MRKGLRSKRDLFILFSTLLLLLAHGQARAGDAPGLVAMLPDTPGFFKLLLHTTSAGKPVDLPFRLFIPKGYDTTTDHLGLLIYLNDDDARGSDLSAVVNAGPEKLLRTDQNFAQNFRMLVVTPQCPANTSWDAADITAAVVELTQKLTTSFRVDADKVVMSGAGTGGAGALRVAAASPGSFAAVVVNSPTAFDIKPMVPQLRHLGLFLSASPKDPTSFSAYGQLAQTLGNGNAVSLEVKQLGNSRDESMRTFFADGNTYAWIGRQKRLTAEQTTAADQLQTKKVTEALAKLPTTAGDYKLMFETWVGDEKMEEPYMISLPTGFEKPGSTWPMLVFLHGKGETDMALEGCYLHGPLAYGRQSPSFRKWLPMIVLLPHHDNTLERAQALISLIHDVMPKFRVDADRVYCTGFSYGGMSTWNLAIADPTLFAAVAPISGRVAPQIDICQRVKDVPAWMICGGGDGPFIEGSTQMNVALAKANADLHFTIIPNEGHESWTRYFSDERLYYWFLEHHRTDPNTLVRAEHPPTAAPNAMGQYRLEFTAQIGGKPITLRYGLYLPKGYGSTTTKWPVMMSLHGDSDQNTDQSLVFEWGTDVDPRVDPAKHNSFPMIGVAPQCPAGSDWSDPKVHQALMALLDEMSKTLAVDPDQIYGVGVQGGGNGMLQLAAENPHRFAAVSMLLAAAVTSENDVSRLRNIPIRLLDRSDQMFTATFARQSAAALRAAGAEVSTNRLYATDYARWKPYYTEPNFCTWLLQHHRLTVEQTKAMDDRNTRMAAVSLPATAGTFPQHFDAAVDGHIVSFDYRLYLPKGYEKGSNKYPMMLYLHDSAVPATQPAWGPDVVFGTDPKLVDSVSMIALCPQLPAGRKWDEPAMARAVVALVNQITSRCRVDPQRIYTGGVGAGSAGALNVVAQASDLFAGIACAVPSPGAPDSMDLANLIPKFPPMGLCLLTTAAQSAAANTLADGFRKDHDDVQVMQLPDESTTAQRQPFAGPQLFQWLITHQRHE